MEHFCENNMLTLLLKFPLTIGSYSTTVLHLPINVLLVMDYFYGALDENSMSEHKKIFD